MRRVPIRLGPRSYEVRIGAGLLDRAGEELRALGFGERAFVASDTRVHRIYGPRLERSLRKAGFRAARFLMKPGEGSKNLSVIRRLYQALLEARVDAGTVVVALGGGVVGDVAGFGAATWHRGVPIVHLPTTLLAQVDSSIGGKTGVDLPGGKNLVGAFHQPSAVLVDPECLSTLPDREYRSGLAEVVKYGMIRDARLFSLIEKGRSPILERDEALLGRVIERCARIKAAYVARDELDRTGVRAELNFGHTFGHAIESATGYRRYLHGEAVAIGMAAASRVALEIGWLEEADRGRLLALLRSFALPVGGVPVRPESVCRLLSSDKKARRGRLRIVLTKGIGLATVHESAPDPLLRRAIREVCEGPRRKRVRAREGR